MQEYQKFICEGSIEEAKNDIHKYSNNLKDQTPSFFYQEKFNLLREKARKSCFKNLGLEYIDKPLIFTGHQPGFHHPGILIKDLFSHSLAKEVNGYAIHILVETDTEEYEYSFPHELKSGFLEKRNISYLNKEGLFLNPSIDLDFFSKLSSCIENSIEHLPSFFSQERRNYILKNLKFILQSLYSKKDLVWISEKIRTEFLHENGIEVYTIRSTELLASEAFQEFMECIYSHGGSFREIHNQALKDYRIEHRIKNHAQPLPDLTGADLPFWIYENGNRNRLSDKMNIQKETIFPSAITLSMYVRMFLAEYFVHGTGGKRYEVIGDKLFEKFFSYKASSYSVVSCTMNLQIPEEILSKCIDKTEYTKIQRVYEFSPEKFLEKDNPLYLKKLELLGKLQEAGADKKSINKSIQALHQDIRLILQDKKILPSEEELKEYETTMNLQKERTFPFYYYNIQEMLNIFA